MLKIREIIIIIIVTGWKRIFFFSPMLTKPREVRGIILPEVRVERDFRMGDDPSCYLSLLFVYPSQNEIEFHENYSFQCTYHV